MFTDRNFKSKKELKAAVDAWNATKDIDCGTDADKLDRHAARAVTYYQPGPFGGNEPKDGTIYCEGPHYPAPHKWYAQCTVRDGVIIKVK